MLTHGLINRECINRICEAANLKSSNPRNPVDRKISSMLGETPKMEKAGANVQLTVTSLYLRLSDLDTGQVGGVKTCPLFWPLFTQLMVF